MGYFLLFNMSRNHYSSSFILELWILPLTFQCSMSVTGVPRTGRNFEESSLLCLFFSVILLHNWFHSFHLPSYSSLSFPLYVSQHIQMQGLVISFLDCCHGFLPGLILPPIPKFVVHVSTHLLLPLCSSSNTNLTMPLPFWKPFSDFSIDTTHCYPLLSPLNKIYFKVHDYHYN